jgi:hypothetical protein
LPKNKFFKENHIPRGAKEWGTIIFRKENWIYVVLQGKIMFSKEQGLNCLGEQPCLKGKKTPPWGHNYSLGKKKVYVVP